MEDFVDICIFGDVVIVIGIIGVINNYMDIGGGIDFIIFMVFFIVCKGKSVCYCLLYN